MLELAKKITKSNKAVTLYQKRDDQILNTKFHRVPIINMFMTHIGSDVILYDYEYRTDSDGKKRLYAIFAEIMEEEGFQNNPPKSGGGLWVCRTEDIDADDTLSIIFASDTFEIKEISNDCCYEKFLWCFSNKLDWDKIEDVSTKEEKLRFLDKYN